MHSVVKKQVLFKSFSITAVLTDLYYNLIQHNEIARNNELDIYNKNHRLIFNNIYSKIKLKDIINQQNEINIFIR